MARRLWGRLSSVNVQKVVWCLEELRLPYERIEAGGAHGVVDTPEYRRLNPTGLVPTLEEDGTVFWESNAIVRYLADAAGALWPEERRARAEADRWMDWQTTNCTPGMRDAFWGLVRTAPEKRDEPAIAASLDRSEAACALLDRHLDGRDYLVGDTFGVADIAVGCAVHRWLHLPTERRPRPALEAWYARIAARPASRGALPVPIA